MALAADGAGNLWVADSKGGRVLRYDANLVLAQTIAGFERPEGVAVTPSGAVLAVSEAKANRISTYDAALGLRLAVFGEKGAIKETKPLPPQLYLDKPAQVAFTPTGNLLVADRGNDMVQAFGLPGTPLVLAMAGASLGGARLASAADGPTAVVQRIGGMEGGRLDHPDGTVVDVPAGALPQDQDISVARAPKSAPAAGLAEASSAHQFGPEGLTFSEPASLTLAYEPELMASAGLVPAELKVHWWNPKAGTWEALASAVDETARTVTAHVAHFSLYQLLAPAHAAAFAADPEAAFAFRAIYMFPNPAVRSQRPAIHAAIGKADKVTVRFYDLTGQLLHEAVLTTPSVVDDGSGPQFAYEYAWDGRIASGIYFYAVTAEKNGSAPIRRVGKFAVVR